MNSKREICTLEFLIGTLSTAYKGAITSLAVKDFCIIEESDFVAFKGTILSMPEGSHDASLIRRGIELARGKVLQGNFELKAPAEQVLEAKDLQIDIVQSGRHIGTFLLKKENSQGVYVSATELSEELKQVDFRKLTGPLADKIGLLKKSEDIIADILSTKKNHASFSERLHSFSSDLFWAARDVFYSVFGMLVHFSLQSAERTDPADAGKPLENFLDMIRLPLEHETDGSRLRPAVDAWLNELKSSSLNLTVRLRQVARIFSSISERVPDAEIGPVLVSVLHALRNKLLALPVLERYIPAMAGSGFSGARYEALDGYTDAGRSKILDALGEVERRGRKRDVRIMIDFLADFDAKLLDEGNMTRLLYETIVEQMTPDSADRFVSGITAHFPDPAAVSARGLENLKVNIPLILGKLISYGRIDACRLLLTRLSEAGSPIRDELALEAGIARVIIDSAGEELIADYSSILEQVLIPAPKVKELSTETWAEIANPLHLDRLAKFMDILRLSQERLRNVLVHVIADLHVSGVFIPDDRLFQRRVSSYLNAGALRSDFLLNYLFLERLPVYYHEVGAVSTIRDFSTEIDSWGNDPVLYFLRKQVHVNASNYNVRLIEKIIFSWVFNDPSILRGVLPADVYENMDHDLISRYAETIKPFFESLGVLDERGLHPDRLTRIPENELKEKMAGSESEIAAKVVLLCMLYRSLVGKYSIRGGREFTTDNIFRELSEHAERGMRLKEILLSGEKTAARESLYFKRHIAFGIPSVLGTYHEPKFDAIADLLRNDSETRQMLEDIITIIGRKNGSFSTEEAVSWLGALARCSDILRIHGIQNMLLEELAVAMTANRLFLTQVIDMLGMWQKELAWIVETVNRTFHRRCMDVLRKFPEQELPDYLMNLDRTAPDFFEKAADIVIRNVINSIPGLVEADRMIDGLHNAFSDSCAIRGDSVLIEQTPEERSYYLLDRIPDQDIMRLGPRLGGKAKNIAFLNNRGFTLPFGVVLPVSFTTVGDSYIDGPEFKDILRDAVSEIEKRTGSVFGDSVRPLFLSVRSGSYVSMPGILSSVLYCGMNRQTLFGFSEETGNPQLAWDSYRRFLEHYAVVVFGLDAAVFENIMSRAAGEDRTSGQQGGGVDRIKRIVEVYQKEIARAGYRIPDDVYEQLQQCVRAIYASWSGGRAESFRRATKTSVHWGTAVTLMQMIFANSSGGGASVFFTRNPFSYEAGIYGETREGATGDDLVYGRQMNRPIAKTQAIHDRERDVSGQAETAGKRRSLEESDPDLFIMHHRLAERIEHAMGGLPQEVEVCYTRQADGTRKIFVLQTRRMEFSSGRFSRFSSACHMENVIIGRGIGAYGGAMSGIASFAQNPQEVVSLQRESGLPVILLRTSASTDDVSLMPLIRGIITSSGGVTSHAAVLARQFGVNAVLACAELKIRFDEGKQPFARIGESVIRTGTPISIDGSTGLVFSGVCFLTEASV